MISKANPVSVVIAKIRALCYRNRSLFPGINMKHLILGTAGHVDHGKTELIKALTGVDTDRLPEEKEKGISIELGFAPMRFGSDLNVGVVDVPGHESFIKTMVAGASGIDMVLLCIAADEGIKPQTKEHINICDILGVKNSIVVITKTDLASDKELKDLKNKVKDFLSGTVFEASKIIDVSSKNGSGIEDLKRAIKDEALRVDAKRQDGNFRMSIDRVFSIKGFGTVATGTSLRGKVKEGDKITVSAGGVSRINSVVRGIETFQEKLKEAGGGLRLGLNLGNIDKDSIRRGDIISKSGTIRSTSHFDAWIKVIEDCKVHSARDYRIHFGTSGEKCRIKMISKRGDQLVEGGDHFVRIKLKSANFMEYRQRFVIRSLSPSVTVAGGSVLKIDPRAFVDEREYIRELEVLKDGDAASVILTLIKSSRAKGIYGEALLQELDGAFRKDLVLNTLNELKESRQIMDIAGYLIDMGNLKVIKDQIKERLSLYQRKNPIKGGMSISELRQDLSGITEKAIVDAVIGQLMQEGDVRKEGERLTCDDEYALLSEHERRNIEKIISSLESGGLNPPKLKQMSTELGILSHKLQDYLQHLQRNGKAVRVSSDYYCSAVSIKDLERSVLEVINEKGSITVADFKDITGTTRKYAIPLLEYLDNSKITLRREDNSRVKGPAAS